MVVHREIAEWLAANQSRVTICRENTKQKPVHTYHRVSSAVYDPDSDTILIIVKDIENAAD